MSDIVTEVYNLLRADIDANSKAIAQVHNVTEQAGFSDGIPAYTFANLPTTGLGNGTSYITTAFCSNGRKSGEGAGTGTGVPVYWNAATSQWLKFSTDTVVTI
jgi:hypothetical protein